MNSETEDPSAEQTQAQSQTRTRVQAQPQTQTQTQNQPEDVRVLAVSFQRRYVGIAYVDLAEQRLTAIDDIKTCSAADASADSDAVQVIKSMILQVKPTRVLVPTKLDPRVLTELEKDAERMAYVLAPRASHEFSDEVAKRLVQEMSEQGSLYMANGSVIRPAGYDIRVSNQQVDDGGSTVFIDTLVEAGKSSVGCMGALLLFVQRVIGSDFDSSLGSALLSIEQSSLHDTMFVPNDTLQSLQVFDSESHPNMHKNTNKEGVSLFGILNFTCTTLGSELLETWLMRPSTNILTIQTRQDHIEQLQTCDMKKLQGSLRKVKNVYTILGNLSSGRATLSDWKNLMMFFLASRELRSDLPDIWVKELFDDPETREVVDGCYEMLYEMIDFETSAIEQRLVITPQADPDLEELKHTYDNIESILLEASEKLAVSLPAHVQSELSVIYFPQLGYLVCIPVDEQGTAVYTGDDWQLSFATATNAYYKTAEMKEMDEQLGDVYAMICDREIEIAIAIQQKILDHVGLIQSLAKLCAELDCHLALSQAAVAYNFTRPIVTEENVVEIKNGRHPLYELSVDTFVGNDTEVGGTHPIVIMAGANYSGKTVYLTQVALIVLMAHMGSFVPADYAKIGVTDKILVRLMTGESVSKLQSAFLIDLRQMSTIFRNMTHKSLVIIDEFGKGTNGTDGAALFGSAINFMLELAESPKVFASTHFHSLFEHGVINDQRLTINHMQVQVSDSNEITYLYTMQRGLANSSFGVCCAAMCGIPKPIITRAEQVVDQMTSDGDLCALITYTNEEKQKIENAVELSRELLRLDTTDTNAIDAFLTTVANS